MNINPLPDRFIYETVPLTPEEARQRKQDAIENQTSKIAYLEQELQEEKDYLQTLIDSPPDTERQVYRRVKPGDPDYDSAKPQFEEKLYQGDFSWINITPT